MIEDKGFVYGVIFVSLVGFLCYVNTFKAQFVYDDKYVSFQYFLSPVIFVVTLKCLLSDQNSV